MMFSTPSEQHMHMSGETDNAKYEQYELEKYALLMNIYHPSSCEYSTKIIL
jgi:hypothetical protein